MEDRILALDYGEKRIGAAVSDPLGLLAHPLPYIANTPRAISEIVALLREYDIAELVLGLPKSLNGQESAKSSEVRAFADKLRTETMIPIHFRDERMSTVAVTKHLISVDVKRKARKEIVDSQAAAFVLQGYMDEKKMFKETKLRGNIK